MRLLSPPPVKWHVAVANGLLLCRSSHNAGQLNLHALGQGAQAHNCKLLLGSQHVCLVDGDIYLALVGILPPLEPMGRSVIMCCLEEAACQADNPLPHCSLSVVDVQDQTAPVESEGERAGCQTGPTLFCTPPAAMNPVQVGLV